MWWILLLLSSPSSLLGWSRRIAMTMTVVGASSASSSSSSPLTMNEMECIPHESDDGSIVCTFRVMKPSSPSQREIQPQEMAKATTMTRLHSSVPTFMMNGDQADGVCIITADISMTTSTMTKSDELAKAAAAQQQEQQQQHAPIKVGKNDAIYQPPFSQYGMHVGPVLTSHSSIVPNDSRTLDMVSWYIQLGHAHLKDVESSSSSLGMWYHAELAINAYQEALKDILLLLKLKDDDDAAATITKDATATVSTSILQPSKEEYLANINYSLGEAYSLDPKFQHLKEALHHYQQAYTLYQQLRYTVITTAKMKDNDYDVRVHSSTRLHLDKVFGDSCLKMGMMMYNQYVMQQQQRQQQQTIMLGSGATTYDSLFGDDDSSSTPSLQDFAAMLDLLWNSMGSNGASATATGFDDDEDMDETLSKATNFLDEAILIYRQYVFSNNNNNDGMPTTTSNVPDDRAQSSSPFMTSSSSTQLWLQSSPQEKRDWQSNLAMAYQQGANVAILTGHFIRARELMNHGLELNLQYILPNLEDIVEDDDGNSNMDVLTAKTSIGDLYLSLSDVNLQVGDYENAKRSYEHATDWLQKHDIEVARFASFYSLNDFASGDVTGDNDGSDNGGVNESIRTYRRLLQEYREMVASGKTGGTTKTPGGHTTIYPQGTHPNQQHEQGAYYYFEQDDGYEGDLLSAIGAMYLSKGDTDLAIECLEKAIKLHEGALVSTNNEKSRHQRERIMADTQFNLAMALFRSRRFEESKRLHFAALDTYQRLYGDGVNPFKQGIEEWHEGLSDILPQSLIEEYAQKAKDILQPGGNDASKVKIDMDKYKASILNATTLHEDKDEL